MAMLSAAPAFAQVVAAPEPAAIEPTLNALQDRVAALSGRVDSLEANFKRANDASAALVATIARLHAAGIALQAGQKLGEVPGATAALARYADTAPPTEASLRLSFEMAAIAAHAASTPDNVALSTVDRMWQRVQTLITIRHGNQIVVGTPAAVTLSAARLRLEAGDLTGAVAALSALDAPAKAAMAAWLGEAQALLDARAALADLVAKY